MLDTVRLRSPYVTESTAQRIEQHLVRRSAVEMATGTVIWEFTTGSLEGSFDSRISVQLNRSEYRMMPPLVAGGRARPMLFNCDPYLIVEGSVHKAMLGHNVTGGPICFAPAVYWFLDHLEDAIDIELPTFEDWLPERVDWAECYSLEYTAIEEYIRSLNAVKYPRRKVHRYASEAIFAPGTTTAVKVYHKGPEYAVHDKARIKKAMGTPRAFSLQTLANGIMRVEVSVKAKKIHQDLGDKAVVSQVTREYLETVHDEEVTRLLREGAHEMETVRTHTEVKRRLEETYKTGTARTLFGVWCQLATVGEDEVRSSLTRRTFYHYRKCITEAGCSWNGTDIIIRKSAIPDGFTLSRRDPRRIVKEDQAIQEMLLPYRAMVA